MKYFNQVSIILLFLATSLCYSCSETKPVEVVDQVKEIIKDAPSDKLLRHVVLFKFKDDAPAEEVEKLNEGFNALPEAISVIKEFEWGINNSPENLHQGFTHCYLISFASEEDRDSVYLPHPAHQAFVASLQPYIEKAFVVDYWTNR
jgi:hypothetical protein